MLNGPCAALVAALGALLALSGPAHAIATPGAPTHPSHSRTAPHTRIDASAAALSGETETCANPVNYVEVDGHMAAEVNGEVNPDQETWVRQHERQQFADEAAAACRTSDRCMSVVNWVKPHLGPLLNTANGTLLLASAGCALATAATSGPGIAACPWIYGFASAVAGAQFAQAAWKLKQGEANALDGGDAVFNGVALLVCSKATGNAKIACLKIAGTAAGITGAAQYAQSLDKQAAKSRAKTQPPKASGSGR